MDAVDDVLPDVTGFFWFEMRKVTAKGVAVEEEDVVWVDFADCLVEAGVPDLETGMSWIRGLVEDVVTGNPRVAFVVGRKFFP